MKNLILAKPVVLRASLEDMREPEKRTALELLENAKFLAVGENGIRITDECCKSFLYGSEAVCVYRKSLGLSDALIKNINVNEILRKTEDFDTLSDIVDLLKILDIKNKHLKWLLHCKAPEMFIWNEYRILQERVEFLQNNDWSNCHIVRKYENPDDSSAPVKRKLKSLVDIGYKLE